VLSPDVIDFVESGCATIVGTVDSDGHPYATRAWGIHVLDADRGLVRILLGAHEATYATGFGPDGRIAITPADVRTLVSRQIKGRVVTIEPVTGDDIELHRRHCDHVISEICRTDGYEDHLVRRMVPPALLACIVELNEIFDQTPGPGAGAALGRRTP
jgi:hypothetical protein